MLKTAKINRRFNAKAHNLIKAYTKLCFFMKSLDALNLNFFVKRLLSLDKTVSFTF